MKVCFIILGIFFCSHYVFALQQDSQYYVSTDSNSTVDCGTQENPCATLESALEIACSSTINGSVPIIWVESGYYPTANLTISCDIVITYLSLYWCICKRNSYTPF